jgi:hypothetical protein
LSAIGFYYVRGKLKAIEYVYIKVNGGGFTTNRKWCEGAQVEPRGGARIGLR